MAPSSAGPGRHPTHSEPAYRVLHRAVFAIAMVLAPLALALWFGLCPQYGDPACPNNASHFGILAAYRAADPRLFQIFLFVNAVIPYLYPLSYIGLGLVAMKRSPWLATIGIACGFAGSTPWGLIADQRFMLASLARLHQDTLLAALEASYLEHWEVFVIAAAWVIGHLLGYVFLGLALWRARTVPRWAAGLIVVAAPLMEPIAYGSHIGALQVLGYALVFVASIPVALTILRDSDETAQRTGAPASPGK